MKRFNLSEKKLSVVYVHSSPTRQETLSKEIISIFYRNDQLNATCLILINFVLFNRTQNRLNRPVWKITRPTFNLQNNDIMISTSWFGRLRWRKGNMDKMDERCSIRWYGGTRNNGSHSKRIEPRRSYQSHCWFHRSGPNRLAF